jgi:hypothetical protein
MVSRHAGRYFVVTKVCSLENAGVTDSRYARTARAVSAARSDSAIPAGHVLNASSIGLCSGSPTICPWI